MPRESDVPFVSALMSEHAPERMSEPEVAREWNAPYIVLERFDILERSG